MPEGSAYLFYQRRNAFLSLPPALLHYCLHEPIIQIPRSIACTHHSAGFIVFSRSFSFSHARSCVSPFSPPTPPACRCRRCRTPPVHSTAAQPGPGQPKPLHPAQLSRQPSRNHPPASYADRQTGQSTSSRLHLGRSSLLPRR